MRCDGCRGRKPTRFVIFGKARGFLVVSTWSVEPARLCSGCLESRYRAYTSSTALLGWFGIHALYHTLRLLPGNWMEHERVRCVPALPPEPTPQELAEEEERVARASAAYAASGMAFFGGFLALFSGGWLTFILFGDSGPPSTGRTVVTVIAWILLFFGGMLVVGGASRRRVALTGPFDPASVATRTQPDEAAADVDAEPAPDRTRSRPRRRRR